jgi:uncharacterized protein YlaN (UPF0358 family)
MKEELKYGKPSTYLHEMDKEQVDFVSTKFNRSKTQVQFLFQLVDGDFDKLLQLEVQMKNLFVSYCPSDKEEVRKIMEKKPTSTWFSL